MSLEPREALSLRIDHHLQLLILDQQLLPAEEKWIVVESPEHMVSIIKELKVRGAPLIGVAAALSLAHWVLQKKPSLSAYQQTSKMLRDSRPTAVNLMNALDRMDRVAVQSEVHPSQLAQQALALFDEDVKLCLAMASQGPKLIEDGDSVLTHCNTGGLATVGVGTALGLITEVHRQGRKIHVYVDETRPLLQGGRLTAWELLKAGVPHTLICDNMSAALMAQGKVQKVLVGADRIAANGDFANKIGTYALAVLCKHHGIPFYGVAPLTTVDLNCASGADIPVEQREPREVRGVFGSFGQVTWAPEQSPVDNPAFDVTPMELVTGLVIDGRLLSRQDIQQKGLKGLL